MFVFKLIIKKIKFKQINPCSYIVLVNGEEKYHIDQTVFDMWEVETEKETFMDSFFTLGEAKKFIKYLVKKY